MVHDYLPINREDMKKRGWEQCDFVYVSGDAYVDHPSFGTAIISRLLEAHGYKVRSIPILSVEEELYWAKLAKDGKNEEERKLGIK